MKRSPVVLVFVLTVVISSSPFFAAAQECGFEWAQTVPPRADLFRLFERSGLYVAVGAHGTIVTSTDGEEWALRDSGTTADLFGVDWGEGRFMVVGDGVILSSQDGVAWQIRAEIDNAVLHDVDYGVGRFVAVGTGLDGAVMVSDNGTAWAAVDTGWEGIGEAIVWTGATFVVSGRADVFASEDGMSWDLIGSVPRAKTSVGARVEDLDRVDLAWDGTHFIWVGGLEVFTSRDGTEWYLSTVFPGCEYFSEILGTATGNGKIMVSGISACPDPYIDPEAVIMVSSDDGGDWLRSFQRRGGGFAGITKGYSSFVAVGSLGDVATSANADSWSCPEGACSSDACADGLFDVVTSIQGLLAVGGVGPCDLPGKRLVGGTVLTSADGVDWTINEIESGRFLGAAWNGSRFVAVGQDLTATSVDGLTWQEQPYLDPPTVLRSVQWGAGTFVAVGTGGVVIASEDGAYWARQFSFTEEDLERVLWTGTTFVAVGARGTVLASADGLNWAVKSSVGSTNLHGAAWNGSEYFVVGDAGGLWSSSDLETWTRRFAATDGRLTDITWSGEHLVAVGFEGESEDFQPAVVVASRDGRHWSRLEVLGESLQRVVWTGSQFVAAGGKRSLLRASCLGMLAEIDPPQSEMLWGTQLEMVLRLSEPAVNATLIEVASSAPDVAQVPVTVQVSPGTDQVVIPVDGVGIAESVWISATLPESLGGATAIAQLKVSPPLPDPRRPGGRHAP